VPPPPVKFASFGPFLPPLLISVLMTFLFPRQGFPGVLDSLSTQYEKGLNNDEWRAAFRYGRELGAGTSLFIREGASSSRLGVSPLKNKWKDQQNLALTLERKIRPDWKLLLMGDSRLYSDKQSGYANDIRTYSISLGTQFSNRWMLIPLSAGPKQDTRFGRTDAGFSYGAGLQLPGLESAGYRLEGSAAWDGDELERRKNRDSGIQFGVHRNFEEGTADSLRYSISRQRRDYYVSQAGEVESRTEDGQELANVIRYRVSRPMDVRIYGSFYTRTLTINDLTGQVAQKQRERKDFRAQGLIDLIFSFRRINAGLSLGITGEDQNYWLMKDRPASFYSGMSDAPDNKSRQISLSARMGGRLGESDSLQLFSCLQKHQYDTPDPANFDDRDELRFWIDLQERHRFSEALELKTSLAVHYFHQVYVFGEKSGDNNKIRIFSLHPEVRWAPTAAFRCSQAAEVLANYVEYDYENLFPGIRSFLYRKFRLEDSLWVSPVPKFSVFLQARVELDENGKLLWNPWLEQRLIDRQSVGWMASLDFHPFPGLHLMPGFNVYRRKGYRYPEALASGAASSARELTLDFSNSGPVFKVAYSGVRLLFSMTVGTTRTRTLNAPIQELTRMDLNMSWKL
jgi:hypothetical protein